VPCILIDHQGNIVNNGLSISLQHRQDDNSNYQRDRETRKPLICIISTHYLRLCTLLKSRRRRHLKLSWQIYTSLGPSRGCSPSAEERALSHTSSLPAVLHHTSSSSWALPLALPLALLKEVQHLTSLTCYTLHSYDLLATANMIKPHYNKHENIAPIINEERKNQTRCNFVNTNRGIVIELFVIRIRTPHRTDSFLRLRPSGKFKFFDSVQ